MRQGADSIRRSGGAAPQGNYPMPKLKTGNKLKPLTVYLPPKTAQQVRELAATEKRAVTRQVEHIVEDWLRRRPPVAVHDPDQHQPRPVDED